MSKSPNVLNPHSRSNRQWQILFAVLALCALALGWQRGLGRIDETLYDAAIGLNGRAAPDNIVIIAIDDASIGALGRWPWKRAVHATLLEKLTKAHPKGIALDLVLSEPEVGAAAAETVSGDATFAAALQRAKAAGVRVVMPIILEGKTRNEGTEIAVDSSGARLFASPPLPAFAREVTLAHIHLELDADGIARTAFLQEGFAPDWMPHFSLALAGSAAPAQLPGARNPNAADAARVDASSPSHWLRDYMIHIPFAGPPGTFKTISYLDVLTGKVDATTFKDKYVMVGATAAGLGDAYPTPVSGQARAMPGVEISATILDALLHGRSLAHAPAWANALFTVLPLAALMFALLKWPPRRTLGLAAALLMGCLVFAWGALAFARVWFAPMAALLMLLLAYPLWSYLRLETAVRFLSDEFARLAQEPKILPQPNPEQHAAQDGGDVLAQRIGEVRAGAEYLRTLRRFVADSLDSLPDATLITDAQGQIVLANRAAAALLNSTSPEALRGANLENRLEVVLEEPLPWRRLEASAANVRDPDDAQGIEVKGLAGQHLLVRVVPCYPAEAHTNNAIQQGWIVRLVDISPIRAAEAQRDEALSFLSHDMRSPQSSIMALLELHRMDPTTIPVPDMLNRIERYAERTLTLSEQFVQLGRAQANSYQFAEVDLGAMLQDAVDELWALAQEKGISISLDVHHQGEGEEGQAIVIQADATLLMRVWLNLLSNALKYSPPETTVSVTLNEEAARCVVVVRDQGYGISADDLPSLFGRFRRFQRPGQPSAEGAGLGLTFVKTVVERHGGEIVATSSTTQGASGTAFTVTLPRAV